MKKKIRFIINPLAGSRRFKITEKTIRKNLDLSLFDYEIIHTKAAKHAIELSNEAVLEHYDVVAAVGGDGTVNEVGRALIGKDALLAIVPTGSGNGLARHLKIPGKPSKAIKLINNLKTKTIDTVIINPADTHHKSTSNESFIVTAGVGFDALIAHKFSEFSKRGLLSYIKAVFIEYPKYKTQDYEICVDGKTYMRNAFMISVANSSQYGSNAVIAPDAIIDDGCADVCLLNKFPRYLSPYLTWRLFNKTIDRSYYYEMIRGKEITIKQNSYLIHLDGDPYNMGGKIHIKVNPSSLNVIVPS
ncbi:MAG: diacylglycerol kinase family protein [Bacteroidota bacterium]